MVWVRFLLRLRAFGAQTGQTPWSQKLGEALGGGVITDRVNGLQPVAVATGMTSPIRPTERRRPKSSCSGSRRDRARSARAATPFGSNGRFLIFGAQSTVKKIEALGPIAFI